MPRLLPLPRIRWTRPENADIKGVTFDKVLTRIPPGGTLS